MSFETRGDAMAYLRTYYSAAALDGEDKFLLDATIDGVEHAHRVAAAAGQPLRCLELGCGPVAAWAMCPGAVASELWLAERSEGGRRVLQEWLEGDADAFDWSVYAARVAWKMQEQDTARADPPTVLLGAADDEAVTLSGATDDQAASEAPSSASIASFADGSSTASVACGLPDGPRALVSASPASCAFPPTTAEVLSRTRTAVAGLLDCDLRRTPVLSRVEVAASGAASRSPPSTFHAVVMHSVADAISETPEEFAELVSTTAGLVAPGGSLLISVNTDVDEWHAEATAFSQVRLSSVQVLEAVKAAGLRIVFSRQRSRLPDGKETETAHTMVVLADMPLLAE